MYSLETSLPSLKKIKSKSGYSDFIVIIDNRISKSPEVSKWLKSFSAIYKVKGGEVLKDFSKLEKHLGKILRLKEFHKQTAIIAVGGGSVGDFSGFVASILKRGVGLVHIPTTWLSAIDSSHGGKTALNFKMNKNQIGSFYSAHHVFLCKNILLKIKSKQLLFCALGELFKMALLEGGVFYKSLIKLDFNKMSSDKMSAYMYKFLKPAVEAKYKVVQKDPKDNYQRHILNLGHTMGHAIELNKNINHGIAVALGMEFSIKWSAHKKLISQKESKEITQFLEANFKVKRPKLTKTQVVKALSSDKKRISQKVNFIFLQEAGKPKINLVGLTSVVTEAKRQALL